MAAVSSRRKSTVQHSLQLNVSELQLLFCFHFGRNLIVHHEHYSIYAMDVFKGQFVYRNTSIEHEWWHYFDPSDLDEQECTFQASRAPLAQFV